MGLFVDQQSGRVDLPSGVSVDADLTRAAFLASPAGSEAEVRNYGAPPWIHYSIRGEVIDGKTLYVSICFHDQLLIDVDLTVSHYPPGATDWSNYSLDVEAQTKRFHDELLVDMLGRPSRGAGWLRTVPDLSKTLQRPLRWIYPWGYVFSGHDSKGGGTYIVIRYGNRREEAQKSTGI